jgi:chemotaxis signal transduction protein
VFHVARREEMQANPGSQSRIGVLRHEQQPAPVFSLGSLVGRVPAAADAERHIVITRSAAGWFGLAVDRIVRAPAAGTPQVLPLPEWLVPSSAPWFDGLLTLEDRSCLLLSVHGIDPRVGVRDSSAAPVYGRPRSPARSAASADVVMIFSSDAFTGPGAARYAVPASRVGAIERSLPAVPIPGAPPYVKQLGRWRDTAVPIVNFSDGPSTRDRGSQWHLVAKGSTATHTALVAFAIENDAVLHRSTLADRRVPHAGALPPFVRGVYTVGDARLNLIDVDALIAG